MHAMHLYLFETKLPNLKLKVRPKQLPGSLPLVIVLSAGTNVSRGYSTVVEQSTGDP